ncbi:unnamed protein product [Lepeophtheirus salmonis]|uniref:(salmon louse) hypothetical protein n=1 Tax=Lepeophtheirus salmonis TaxID=72036 RepID=A0A7R8CV78_LEPSM|nr:unnamed protein product [Lepeophtheirus salmonis]CAF2941355.1 unnamed protein product [Lepeophtheirus salmonis]
MTLKSRRRSGLGTKKLGASPRRNSPVKRRRSTLSVVEGPGVTNIKVSLIFAKFNFVISSIKHLSEVDNYKRHDKRLPTPQEKEKHSKVLTPVPIFDIKEEYENGNTSIVSDLNPNQVVEIKFSVKVRLCKVELCENLNSICTIELIS